MSALPHSLDHTSLSIISIPIFVPEWFVQRLPSMGILAFKTPFHLVVLLFVSYSVGINIISVQALWTFCESSSTFLLDTV